MLLSKTQGGGTQQDSVSKLTPVYSGKSKQLSAPPTLIRWDDVLKMLRSTLPLIETNKGRIRNRVLITCGSSGVVNLKTGKPEQPHHRGGSVFLRTVTQSVGIDHLSNHSSVRNRNILVGLVEDCKTIATPAKLPCSIDH